MAAATPNPWPIAPISTRDLDFSVVSYDFASFTDNEQSELPSLEGALDVSLLDYAASIADQTILIASMFTGLDDVFTVLDEMGNDDLESIFGSLSNTATQGDAILSQYNGLIGDNSGSGSGGGGGGTPPGCLLIAIGKQPEFTGGIFTHFPLNLSLQNSSGKTITIKGTSFSPSYPNIYKMSADITGKVLNPGDTLQFAVTVTADGDGEIDSTLTIQTDGPDPQPCVKITMEIVPGPAAPTGGPSGPQPQAITVHIL